MATDASRSIPSVVRGLEYYTGPVYEVELLIETKDEKGRPVRFGSVGGGGRYDGLVSRFRGEPVPATGFSIGVSRLQAALALDRQARQQAGARPGGRHGVRSRPHRRLSADGGGSCAHAGIRAELYLGNPKHNVGQQMKYADRRNAPCVDHPGRRREGQRRGADQGPRSSARSLPSWNKGRDEYLQEAGRGAGRGGRVEAGRGGAGRAGRATA